MNENSEDPFLYGVSETARPHARQIGRGKTQHRIGIDTQAHPSHHLSELGANTCVHAEGIVHSYKVDNTEVHLLTLSSKHAKP